MPVMNEGKRLGDWLKWEAENSYSRDIVTILAGSGAERALLNSMVLGRITKGAATGAAVAGNTGNGTITASPAVGAAAKPGIYRAICVEPATDGGKFAVEDPDGILIGIATQRFAGWPLVILTFLGVLGHGILRVVSKRRPS